MGTKNNPGKYDCYAKLEPDEPFFVLRGKDPIGWVLVNLWVSLRKYLAPDAIPEAYLEKLNEAKVTADKMKEWCAQKGTSTGTVSEMVRKALINFAYGRFGTAVGNVCKDCQVDHGGCMLCDSLAGELAERGHRKREDGNDCSGVRRPRSVEG